jgi:hypothetical protein
MAKNQETEQEMREMEEQEQEQPKTRKAKETDPWKIKREVYIPYRKGEEKTWHGAVNDRRFSVPKGQKVEVPLPVFYVIQNQQEAIKKMEEEAERDLAYHDRGVIR